MEKPSKTSKDIGVKPAPKLLFGEGLTLNALKNNAGLSCGLKKVIAYVNYVNYPDTADSSSSELRTIGSIDYLMNPQIIHITNT